MVLFIFAVSILSKRIRCRWITRLYHSIRVLLLWFGFFLFHKIGMNTANSLFSDNDESNSMHSHSLLTQAHCFYQSESYTYDVGPMYKAILEKNFIFHCATETEKNAIPFFASSFLLPRNFPKYNDAIVFVVKKNPRFLLLHKNSFIHNCINCI